MDWIKRNLWFVAGAVGALALMGLAGYYLYSKYQLNNQKMAQLNEQYGKLDQLNRQNPHPGTPKNDNIQAAKNQQQELVKYIEKIRAFYKPIPRIPDQEKVTSQEFTAALRRTIDQLQKDATNSSVSIPPNYSFSFEAQKPRVTFAAGSLEPLADQLGEVKAICEVLFQAKINSLDNLRRTRVSPDDSAGPQTDYHERQYVTNQLAVIPSYEISFRSFSSELATVLAGFASSPHGFIVKTVNVEPAPASPQVSFDPTTMANPYAGMTMPQPMPNPAAESEAQMLANRYGIGRSTTPGAPPPMSGGDAGFAARYGIEGGGGSSGGVPLRAPGTANPYAPTPGYTPVQPFNPYAPGMTPSASPRGGLPTVLDERLIRVTLTVDIVKLLPKNVEK